jgi:hypothetical protein
MNAEFSIGALPSPVMSRAPSNTVTPVVRPAWLATCEEQAVAANTHAVIARHDNALVIRLPERPDRAVRRIA